MIKINSLSANRTKWSNTLKQFVDKLPTNCLSVFDHFVGLALKRLTIKTPEWRFWPCSYISIINFKHISHLLLVFLLFDFEQVIVCCVVEKTMYRSIYSCLKNTHAELHLLCKKCPYSKLFWSAFFHIWTEYGDIRSISPYSVRMRENADQNNSQYGHFSRSDYYLIKKITAEPHLGPYPETHLEPCKSTFQTCLTPSWWRCLFYRNQSIDLKSISMDWFLYDRDIRHERVNRVLNTRMNMFRVHNKATKMTSFTLIWWLNCELWTL